MFKSSDELKKIRFFMGALGQDVEMVGHQAPSVEEEIRGCGILFEKENDVFGQGSVEKYLCAACGTECQEIRPPADVEALGEMKASSSLQMAIIEQDGADGTAR